MNLIDDPNLQGDVANEVREFQSMLTVLESKLSLAFKIFLKLYPLLIANDTTRQEEGLQHLREFNAILRTGYLQLLSDSASSESSNYANN